MNKTAIKNFAVWARRKLISDITYKAGLIGVTEEGIASPLPLSTSGVQFFDIGTKDYAEVSGVEIKQRNALCDAIRAKEKGSDYKSAFNNVVEEVAYTWFNRLIAVRFMEVNNYLPSGIRVLSSENEGKLEPDFVTSPFDTDLEFSPFEKDVVHQLKDENRLDELFRMLFIKQCNKLHANLPVLFEDIEDYTELLLTISFTDKDGIVYHLTHDIAEDDFNVEKEGQVEIIGWLYQFYNIEPKAEVFGRKSGTRMKKEDIPAVTQLFTPDWIVRYMVENSLGRLWLEGHPAFDKSQWKYYLDEAEQEPEVQAKLDEIKKDLASIKPEEIKVIDPCMGSGHILVYVFDVLMQIYENCGYTQRDAAASILQNNIYGLDIDDRAAQLAYFAVMMKARQFSRRILSSGVEPNLMAMRDSSDIGESMLSYIGTIGGRKAESEVRKIADTFAEGKEIGSALKMPEIDFAVIDDALEKISASEGGDLFDISYKQTVIEKIIPLVRLAKILSLKYDVAVTNPPYMPPNGCVTLDAYVKKNYPDSKTDMFAVFIEKCGTMLKKNGFRAMITMHSWMFLSSYEKLRAKMLLKNTVNMAHLGARAFDEIGGEVVQTTAWVTRNASVENCKGTYCRLIEPNTQKGKEDMFLAGENRYYASQANFSKIPGAPVAYWVGENLIEAFIAGKSLVAIANPKQGLATADNNRFLRLWCEVSTKKLYLNCPSREESSLSGKKWFPYNKGGEFRKWYGNNDFVVNWENDGNEIRHFYGDNGRLASRPQNMDYYFKESATWSKISSGTVAFRYKPVGHIFDVAGTSIFANRHELLMYVLAFCNTKVSMSILQAISPTINYEVGHIASLPIIEALDKENDISNLVDETISLSKADWDSFETSWDFKKHPLV